MFASSLGGGESNNITTGFRVCIRCGPAYPGAIQSTGYPLRYSGYYMLCGEGLAMMSL